MEKYSLRWDGFASCITTGVNQLRADNEHCDVTLCCDNGVDKVMAHKVILAACSPLFQKVLQANSGQCGHTNTVLYLKGVAKQQLNAILDFMYTGHFRANIEIIPDVRLDISPILCFSHTPQCFS